MTKKSKGDYAYTLVDVDNLPGDATVEHIKALENIIRVRVLTK